MTSALFKVHSVVDRKLAEDYAAFCSGQLRGKNLEAFLIFRNVTVQRHNAAAEYRYS